MTIGQAYEWIARAGENVQVFCHPRQNVRGTYKEVSVFSNRDRVQSARRERDHGERLIGVFNTDINYNSFKAECEWACREYRQTLASTPEFLRCTGETEGTVGLPVD